jgi:hypothetical protein
LVRIFKLRCRDPRTAKTIRFLDRDAGTHGSPNRSVFLIWKAGIHKPPNRSVFLDRDAGIHGPPIGIYMGEPVLSTFLLTVLSTTVLSTQNWIFAKSQFYPFLKIFLKITFYPLYLQMKR